MTKLKDFTCKYINYNPITSELAESLGLRIPELYLNGEDMAKVAVYIRETSGAQYCRLPYDTCVIAENLGASIKYDDSPLGPRKAEDLLKNPLDFLDLPALDPTKGRLAEVMRACTLLKERGEIPVLEGRGIFDVMNSLIDIPKVIMALTRKGEIEKIGEKLKTDLMVFYKAAEEAGCEFFTYSDASAGLSLIGPRFSKKVTECFTLPLLKKWMEKMDDRCTLQICPKTSFLLTGMGMAEWKYKSVDKGRTYFDAYMNSPEIRITGQKCNHEMSMPSRGRVHYLELI